MGAYGLVDGNIAIPKVIPHAEEYNKLMETSKAIHTIANRQNQQISSLQKSAIEQAEQLSRKATDYTRAEQETLQLRAQVDKLMNAPNASKRDFLTIFQDAMVKTMAAFAISKRTAERVPPSVFGFKKPNGSFQSIPITTIQLDSVLEILQASSDNLMKAFQAHAGKITGRAPLIPVPNDQILDRAERSAGGLTIDNVGQQIKAWADGEDFVPASDNFIDVDQDDYDMPDYIENSPALKQERTLGPGSTVGSLVATSLSGFKKSTRKPQKDQDLESIFATRRQARRTKKKSDIRMMLDPTNFEIERALNSIAGTVFFNMHGLIVPQCGVVEQSILRDEDHRGKMAKKCKTVHNSGVAYTCAYDVNSCTECGLGSRTLTQI